MTSHGIEPKFLSERIGKEFLQVCGNLVLFGEDDQTARLAHHTVGQFRSENKIPRVDSDIQVGDICLTYLHSLTSRGK